MFEAMFGRRNKQMDRRDPLKTVISGTVAVALLGLLMLLPCGCEDDSDNDAPQESSSGELGEDTAPDPRFPDGLHPGAAASATIASTFAGLLTPVAGSNATVVVCMGDSITEGGYPGLLASLTGMQVIDEGRGGEWSSGGLDRIADVLNAYGPNYICILYGANNIINGSPVSDAVDDLVAMVGIVRSNGAVPVVGTLTPMSGSYARFQGDADALNASIRSTVRGSGARVADLANKF